jgi:hypothetical protein
MLQCVLCCGRTGNDRTETRGTTLDSKGGEATPGNAGCWNEGSKHRAQAEPHGLSFHPLDLQRQELKEQACLLKWLHNSSLRRCDRGINSTLFLDISFFLDRNIVLGL